MTSSGNIAIVGGGLAGAEAAKAARAAGWEGTIVVVGDEPHLPYERPPLSKAVLRGEQPPSSAAVADAETYERAGVEVLIGVRVTGIDVVGGVLLLDGREHLPYDRAILATGAEPRRLPVPGADLPGVHLLRTVDDAVALGAAIRAGGRVAVVGAGWIGCEVAASARQLGADVVLVDPSPTPLHRVLGPVVGAAFADLHRGHGVALRMGRGVEAIRGGDRAEGVVLDDGSFEAADVVVVGIGVTPRTELASAAGLAVDDGVVVDASLRTSVPTVLAAGDVAGAWHPRYGRHVRVEHWSAARAQGVVAGRNAAGTGTGEDAVYDELPSFFSDQYDVGLEHVGLAGDGDEVVLRGDPAHGAWLAFWHRDGALTAAMHVNTWDAADHLKALVAEGASLDRV